jgi:hypothetical protein
MPVAIVEAKALVELLSPMNGFDGPAGAACRHGDSVQLSYPEAMVMELRGRL